MQKEFRNEKQIFSWIVGVGLCGDAVRLHGFDDETDDGGCGEKEIMA